MSMKNRIAIVLALSCSAIGFVACGATDGQREQADNGDTAPVLPSQAAAQEIAASSATTQASGGIVLWKIYDSLDASSASVYGVDGSGKVMSIIRIGGDASAPQSGEGVVMESLYPQAGRLKFAANGDTVAQEISPAMARVMAAMGSDFKQSLSTSNELALPGTAEVSWRCWRAGIILGAACGVTIATCLETGGLGCAVGGALCVAAYQDWLCECHDRCL